MKSEPHLILVRVLLAASVIIPIAVFTVLALQTRLVAYDHPALLGMTEEQIAALLSAAWRQDMLNYAAFIVPGTLVLFGLSLAVYLNVMQQHYLTAREMKRRADAEESLRRSQRLEILGQFTGQIAHDFNNRLTAITGNIELTMMVLPDMKKAMKALKNADHAALGAATLIRQLLAFARRQSLAPQPVLINHHVNELMVMIEAWRNNRLEIVAVLDPAVECALLDLAQFEAAIMNLVINARDAMPNGGKLTISTQRCDNLIRVAVADTGTGMSPEVLEHAFEPFFTTKAPGTGTGLGLSQVYGFTKQSGGNTTIQSSLGVGTTIIMELPVLVSSA